MVEQISRLRDEQILNLGRNIDYIRAAHFITLAAINFIERLDAITIGRPNRKRIVG